MQSILSQMKVHNEKCHCIEDVNFSRDIVELVVVFFVYLSRNTYQSVFYVMYK